MPKKSFLLLAFLLMFTSPRLFADIAAIHASALPQETAVLAALDDASQMEPYSSSWTMNWQYPISKDDVVAHLSKDLGFLRLASKNHPGNEELLLLTGMVARLAYNVDVTGSYDTAIEVLGDAEKLAPTDFRAPWFRATLQCQTRQFSAGAEEFLAIESGHAWDTLPAAFWQDYTNCAIIANLPAHALRAVDHLEKLHAGDSSDFATAVDLARHRFDPFDPKKDYEPKDVWQAKDVGNDVVLTSTLCGIRLRVHGDWAVSQLVFTNGSCIAYFTTGPYQATTRNLHPSILLLVQQPKGDETLLERFKRFLTKGATQPITLPHCPAASCLAMQATDPGMYGKDGDGRGRFVAFERDEPAYPGLIFESPLQLPKSEDKSGVQYYRPDQIQQRIPGKLYYLVLLDTAASIEAPAEKDFEFFLENMTVE